MSEIENKMVVDSQWKFLEDDLPNLVAQPEHSGSDFYGFEILEGDQIAIDAENFHEEILREHLTRYLIEQCHFLYKAGIYVDVERSEIILEQDLEKYLHEEHGFIFKTAN